MAIILGTVNNDNLPGTFENDVIDALQGNDTVSGDFGNDVITGGFGSDLLRGGYNNDTIYGNDATDWSGTTAIDTLNGGQGDDWLFGGPRTVFNGGTGSDSASISARSATAGITFASESIADTPDLIFVGGMAAGSVVGVERFYVIGSEFDDQIKTADGTDVLVGNGGNDILAAGNNTDVLYGGAGTDTLNGGSGKDDIYGGENEDYLLGGYGDDRIFALDQDFLGNFIGFEADTIYAGGGNDTILASALSTIGGGTGFDVLTLSAGNFLEGMNFSYGGADGVLYTIFEGSIERGAVINIERFDKLDATAFDDTISFTGEMVGSVVNGKAGDDFPHIAGGNGFGGDGSDTVEGSDLNDGLSAFDQFFVTVVPEDRDVLIGNGGNDNLTGHFATSFDGGSGQDTAVIYCGSASAELAFNYPVDGSQTDILVGGIALGSVENVEAFRFFGSSNFANILHLSAGSDEVYTGAAADSIDADAGNNTVQAYEGDDTIIAGAGKDSIDAGDGADSVDTGEGGDSIIAGAGNDTINSGTGSDWINGFFGLDSVEAGDGNDTIRVSDGEADTVNAGGGDDSVAADRFDSIDGGLGSDTASFDLDNAGGSAVFDATDAPGDSSSIVIDGNSYGAFAGIESFDIIGTAGADSLAVGIEADSVDGGYGNDTVLGRAGDDLLFGGVGNDSIEGGDGDDRVFDYFGDDVLNGGIGNDTILTNGGILAAATINGGDGNDRMTCYEHTFADGGTGNDHLILNLRSDFHWDETPGHAHEFQRGGNIIGSVTGFETFTIKCFGNDSDVRTGSGADKLIGSHSNTLDGASGDDTISGGYGNNIIIGGTGRDLLRASNNVFQEQRQDIFVFESISDSGATRETADIIENFERGSDKLDVSRIDANAMIDGHQAFTVPDFRQFTAAGQIRWDDDEYVLEFNTDKDPAAEMMIYFATGFSPDYGDFLLGLPGEPIG